MSVNIDRDLVTNIAGMLGMSQDMEEHFLKLIEAAGKSDVEWMAAVRSFQSVEPTFTDAQAEMVRSFWNSQNLT